MPLTPTYPGIAMQHSTTIKDIPVSLFTELVSRNHTYLYSMLLHDFKGHLSSIAINLELLKETLLPDETPMAVPDMDLDTTAATRQSIDSIEKEIENLSSFMQMLLSNVEIPRLSPSPVSLLKIVRGAWNFVSSEIKRSQVKIDIRSAPDGDDAMVAADRKVMEQVFLNLLLHMLNPKNRAPSTIEVSLKTDSSCVEVTFKREFPQETLSQPDGYFRDDLLVKTDDGKNFLDQALRAHGGSLHLDNRANHRVYTIRLPALA